MNRQYTALSGVAIFLIVVNHAIHFGLQVSPVNGHWLRGLIVLQAFGAFAVPAFLFVSGAFLCYAARELSFRFVRTSMGRILWPYVIWSAIFYVIALLTRGEGHTAVGYVKNLLVGYPYHFVPLLLFWYAATPVLVRAARRHGAWLLAAVAAYQLLLLALRFPGVFLSSDVLPPWADRLAPPVLFRPLSDWAVYFPLGLVLSMHQTAIKPYLLRLRGLTVGAAGALFILGILNAFDATHTPWARFLAPVPLMFVLPIIDRSSIPLLRRFEFLGRRSYGVYLVHFALLNLLVLVVVRLRLDRLPIVVFPTLLLSALGLALVLMDITARSSRAGRAYRYVFGTVPPRRDDLSRDASPSCRSRTHIALESRSPSRSTGPVDV
jgi:fucose 4-O-acetylase-like acetyltransferase